MSMNPSTATPTKPGRKAVARTQPAARPVAEKPARARKPAARTTARKSADVKPHTPPPKAPRATRALRSRGPDIDPAAQLDKLSPDAPRSRGLGRSVVAAGPAMPDGFFANFTGEPLNEQAFADAAQALGCEVAAVKAVAEVESRGGGFDALRRPKVLYERHVFARCTVPRGKFDAQSPDVSGFRKPYAPGTYGNGEKQYARLAQALLLDRTAALKALSWGMFQILGENHKACGFATVDEFVASMTVSEVEHLKAFVNFIRGDARLSQAIRKKDWAGFARGYNGAEYAKFQYDTKIAAAFRRHGGAG